MAGEDYKHLGQVATRDSTYRSQTKSPRFWLGFLAGTVLGLLVTLVGVYLFVPGQHAGDPAPSEPHVMATPCEDQDTPPAAQYDFYSILPERGVNLSEWETETYESSIEATATPNDDLEATDTTLLILQVGSFQEFSSANKIKAELALLGIKSDIQRVVIHGQDVRYRVRTNPYPDARAMKAARRQLLEGGIEHVPLSLRAHHHSSMGDSPQQR